MKIAEYHGFNIRRNNSCGSGVKIANREGKSIILTNAHVVGTQLGGMVDIRWTDQNRVHWAVGRIIAAGYRRGQAVDWALIASEDEALAEITPHAMQEVAATTDLITIGSPRCEEPSLRRLRFVRAAEPIAYAVPTAVGGQSGSGITSNGRTVGLITWTDHRHTIFQTSSGLRQTMSPDWFLQQCESPLPDGLEPACDNPQPCEEGMHIEAGTEIESIMEEAFSAPADEANADDWATIIRLLAEAIPLLIQLLRSRR
ncbi:MAG: hypothetical protein ACK4UN_12980 [Limisphaerales bacterium]